MRLVRLRTVPVRRAPVSDRVRGVYVLGLLVVMTSGCGIPAREIPLLPAEVRGAESTDRVILLYRQDPGAAPMPLTTGCFDIALIRCAGGVPSQILGYRNCDGRPGAWDGIPGVSVSDDAGAPMRLCESGTIALESTRCGYARCNGADACVFDDFFSECSAFFRGSNPLGGSWAND